jgi:threonine dehydrogenase-like Zn-dependent dehydrogenase
MTEIADVPVPAVRSGHLLIRTRVSLISAGTERMLVEFGRAGWIDKARQQPEKVRQVLDKVRTDGLLPTLEAVRSKLEQPLPLGYCNVGTVIAVCQGVTGYAVGDRVVSNGWHAEVVAVPANLCARIPDTVSDEEAAFTVIGAIALQGLRLVQPTMGEGVAVIGLGLVGLLAVQLLRAQGCRVLGVDVLPDRLALARRFGAETVDLSAGEDPVAAGQAFSRGWGLDAVLIAAATDSSDPVRQAARMCRKRGRIVLVGVAGLELSRAEFYEKELTFQVSCSYGPGRHDPAYELKGQDYPLGFVRWTAQRNFEAVLELLASGRLDVAPLISHRFPIDDAERAYALLEQGNAAMGILLTYLSPAVRPEAELRRATVKLAAPVRAPGVVTVAVVGAGSYATGMLIPALHAAGVRLKTVESANGVSAAHAGRKFGFELAGTDPAVALADPEVNAVVIATRHDSHARYVMEALRAGKHVFVEKPLCLTPEELREIEATCGLSCAPAQTLSCDRGGRVLMMVGFNRRFSPLVQKMRALLAGVPGPKACMLTVNAGTVPPEHWTRDPVQGGGRLSAKPVISSICCAVWSARRSSRHRSWPLGCTLPRTRRRR